MFVIFWLVFPHSPKAACLVPKFLPVLKTIRKQLMKALNLRQLAAAGAHHSPHSEHVLMMSTSPSLLLLTVSSGKRQRKIRGCDVNGDETVCALSSGELETEVRYGQSKQLMGSTPSQVAGAISTAQLHFFFVAFFLRTLKFHANLLEHN